MQPVDRRPPRLVRIAVLVGAVACLGLAMCAHSDRPPRATPPSNASATAANPDATPAPASPPAYFYATKAAGPLYPEPQAPPPQQQSQSQQGGK